MFSSHKLALIVGTIIFVLFLVFGVIIFFQNKIGQKKALDQPNEPKVLLQESDHFSGNRNAPVKIVEYAEPECIYCKRLHPVLLRVLREREGKVALVYRHFPLARHPKSLTEATALECAAEASGEAYFWKYLDVLYEATPSDNKIDLAILPGLAEQIGIPEEKFTECLASNRYQTRIQNDLKTGVLLGVDSVPHLIIIASNGKEFVFSKSPSYAALNATVLVARGLEN